MPSGALVSAGVGSQDALSAEGWKLIEQQVLSPGVGAHRRPSWWARRKLKKAIRCFRRALETDPEGWPSMWALGKIYQRLGEHDAALKWFLRAYDLNPTQPDVAREVGPAALRSGDAEIALRLCSAAVKNDPEDPRLVANMALAYLLAGDDPAAVTCAESAAQRDPADDASARVLVLVHDVTQGRQARPGRLSGAFPA